VSVGFESGRTKQTTQAEVVLNVDAREARPISTSVPTHFSRSMTVYDSLGEAQQLKLDFEKNLVAGNANQWTMSITDPNYVDTGSRATDGPFIQPTTVPTSSNVRTNKISIDLVFGSDGKIVQTNDHGTLSPLDDTGTVPINASLNLLNDAGATIPLVSTDGDGNMILSLNNINWTNDSDLNQDIKVDLSGLTQSASDYSVGVINQDGAELGLRTGIAIDTDGNVVASFSNGLTQNLARIPIATFTNPNGLQERTGNVYIQTSDSGAYNLREAGQSGAGKIATSSLEASNVDLADEFSRMIVTQRAYSAGTKIISTTDQMLTELLQLR